MVSIIIPVYNVKAYLLDCLNSIINQTEIDWEAILIDDGSTDGSGVICDEYSHKDCRFKVIHQENSGAARAKNIGLDYASGEYIAFVDSDDTVENTWLATCLQHLQEFDVVEYGFDLLFPEGYKQNDLIVKQEFNVVEYLDQYLENWQCSLFWNKIFKSSLLQDVRFHNERRCIDDEFFTYKVLSSAKKIIRISDVLYHYRQRGSSAVYNSKNFEQKTKDSLDILRERYDWICIRFPELKKRYLKHDVEILHYFARDFLYTKETVKLFHSISRFYMLETLLNFPDKISIINALTLLRYTNKRLLSNKLSVKKNDINCFE